MLRVILLMCSCVCALSADLDDCIIELDCKACQGAHTPVVEWPAAERGSVRVPHGRELRLACGAAEQAPPLRCSHGQLFTADGARRTLRELRCSEDPFQDVLHPVVGCMAPHEGHVVRWRHVLAACLDIERNMPLYALLRLQNDPAPRDTGTRVSLFFNIEQIVAMQVAADTARVFADEAQLQLYLLEALRRKAQPTLLPGAAGQRVVAARLLSRAYFPAHEARAAAAPSNTVRTTHYCTPPTRYAGGSAAQGPAHAAAGRGGAARRGRAPLVPRLLPSARGARCRCALQHGTYYTLLYTSHSVCWRLCGARPSPRCCRARRGSASWPRASCPAPTSQRTRRALPLRPPTRYVLHTTVHLPLGMLEALRRKAQPTLLPGAAGQRVVAARLLSRAYFPAHEARAAAAPSNTVRTTHYCTPPTRYAGGSAAQGPAHAAAGRGGAARRGRAPLVPRLLPSARGARCRCALQHGTYYTLLYTSHSVCWRLCGARPSPRCCRARRGSASWPRASWPAPTSQRTRRALPLRPPTRYVLHTTVHLPLGMSLHTTVHLPLGMSLRTTVHLALGMSLHTTVHFPLGMSLHTTVHFPHGMSLRTPVYLALGMSLHTTVHRALGMSLHTTVHFPLGMSLHTTVHLALGMSLHNYCILPTRYVASHYCTPRTRYVASTIHLRHAIRG
ncbi:hypothetical protein ACJJTC_004490 [Scirpophaga incertulas]